MENGIPIFTIHHWINAIFVYFQMSSIGIDLGSRTIKVCEWKEGESNSAGIGPEVVISDRNQREYPYVTMFCYEM